MWVVPLVLIGAVVGVVVGAAWPLRGATVPQAAALGGVLGGCAGMAAALVADLTARFFASGWIADHATEAEVVAAVAGLAATLVLLWLTRTQAKAAAVSAATSERAAIAAEQSSAATERQQRAASRPTVTFEIAPDGHEAFLPRDGVRADRFKLEVKNAGPGPAFDVRVEIRGPLRYRADPFPVQPFALMPGDSEWVAFSLDEGRPFSHPDDPSWPLTDADKERERRMARRGAMPRGTSELPSDAERRQADERASIRSFTAFLDDMARRIDDMDTIGFVVAFYRGVGDLDGKDGPALVSSARIAADLPVGGDPEAARSGAPPWFYLLLRRLRLHAFSAGLDMGTVVMSGGSSASLDLSVGHDAEKPLGD